MDHSRFDAVTRFMASRRLSRRQVLSQGGAGLAAGVLAATGFSAVATAQEATPAADKIFGGHNPTMLFVQSFQSGAITPKEGAEGQFTVTLDHGLGQTIYFSDRPERIVGAMPTEQFLDILGFPASNPPNAALVVDLGEGATDFAVVELFNPVYDEASHSATYDVQVLEEWEQTVDMTFAETTIDLAALAPSFGTAHLFIDGLRDCPDGDIVCFDMGTSNDVGTFPTPIHDGFCYSNYEGLCLPCDPWRSSYVAAVDYWSAYCNLMFAECKGNCHARDVWRYLP